MHPTQLMQIVGHKLIGLKVMVDKVPRDKQKMVEKSTFWLALWSHRTYNAKTDYG